MALGLYAGSRGCTRWARWAVHWGGLTLALVDCRSPPPIARTPADPLASRELVPDEPPLSSTKAAEASPSPPPSAEPAPPDYSNDQRELTERYAGRRSQGVLRGEAS